MDIDPTIAPRSRRIRCSSRISLIEGDSISQATVDQVKALIKPAEKVMVILDSNHSKAHVVGELEK